MPQAQAIIYHANATAFREVLLDPERAAAFFEAGEYFEAGRLDLDFALAEPPADRPELAETEIVERAFKQSQGESLSWPSDQRSTSTGDIVAIQPSGHNPDATTRLFVIAAAGSFRLPITNLPS